MNRKTIEKAAHKYAESIPQSDERKEYSREDFIAGVEWHINSVWHPTNELPKYSGYLAALMNNGLMETIHYTVGIGFCKTQLKGYALWSYVDDLLPYRKEDKQ